MQMPQAIKQQACEGLLHFAPKKTLARELGISTGSLRDWAIFIEHGFFDWIDKPGEQRRVELLRQAVEFWFENYPIGCTDVARRFGIRPATLYGTLKHAVAALPEQLRPKRIRYWDAKPAASLGTFRMQIKKLSDIPANRPSTLAERKALLREVEDARARLICAESMLEAALESCKDELKKRIDAAVGAREKGLGIARVCRVTGLPRSTFCASQKPTPQKIKDDDLAQKIAEIQRDYFCTIGRRRMGAVLYKRFGIKVCETTLRRVMSGSGLSARTRQIRKAKPCAGRANRQQLPDNLLNREFRADRPMFRMVTDVTYVPYFEDGEWHWGCLSLVQDLFDRSIVAWVCSRKQDVRLGLATLQLLSFRGLALGAMLHSDRGSIYTAQLFRETASFMGLTQSFSRTANCRDNATVECFNGTFKVEALYNPLLAKDRPSFKEQNNLIGQYIEFYNNMRPCSIINNRTPTEYRQRFCSTVPKDAPALR